MERLEARICELAGHLTAATCQFLLLIADFDARKGWADWEMPSCAAWLSWKCQIASGTAREQVRVARALGALPAITAGGFVKTGPVVFEDISEKAGLTKWTYKMGTPAKDYIIETKGSGGGLIDYDNDGWLDIYIVNGSTVVAVRAPLAAFETRKCVAPRAATCGLCVTTSTCTVSATRARRSPTDAAVAPPTPESTSSNTNVGTAVPAERTTFTASIKRANSPPEAIFASGPGSCPGLVAIRKRT